ncbi:MAG: hypothetical protein IEMM0002_0675 [bacterium]|nr:MAG: hypothetical protein IEMM0002_0675 [bacterium]
MEEKVQTALDDIRSYLQADGGDVELVEVKDGIAYVRLTGACGSCQSSVYTLKFGIEKALKEKVPELKGVEAV